MEISPFRAVYPNFDTITSPEYFIKNAKQEYNTFKKMNFFEKVNQDAFYVYRIKSRDAEHVGLIGCATVADYKSNKIKKHENILAVKQEQQLKLMISRGAAVKPVLLTYPNVDVIDQLTSRVIEKEAVFYKVKIGEGKEVHTFWKVSKKEDIAKIQKAFAAKVDCSYIADGHHRSSATALMYEQTEKKCKDNGYGQILAAFFPVNQLTIYDYNRVVSGIRERSTAQLMAQLSQVFDIEVIPAPEKPRAKHEITMLLRGEWFRLKWRKEILDKYKDEPVLLDANILDEEVMKNVMAIKDTKTDTRIIYIEGPKGVEGVTKKVQKDENQVGFCLYPVDPKDFIAISDAGQIMPPKSTWFEPRIKNGLLVLEF